jgi:hypothetical protein
MIFLDNMSFFSLIYVVCTLYTIPSNVYFQSSKEFKNLIQGWKNFFMLRITFRKIFRRFLYLYLPVGIFYIFSATSYTLIGEHFLAFRRFPCKFSLQSMYWSRLCATSNFTDASNHWLINYGRHQSKMSSSKKLTCKGTLWEMFSCLKPPPLLGYCLGVV